MQQVYEVIKEEHEFIQFLIQEIKKFQQVILPTINASKMNLFFIGKSGGGKSTLANGIAGKKIIFQKDEGDCFIPIDTQSEIYFDIAVDPFESKTKEPKSISHNEDYQIWDLPGYQDSRSPLEDLKNIIIKKLIIDSSNLSHIIILLPESQLTGDKGGFLIDILNLLSEDDLIPTIIISYAQQTQDINFFKKQLEIYTQNGESILTKSGKILLQKIVEQERVLKFQVPEQIDEFNYELSASNMKEMKDFILQNQHFKKISIKFSLQDDSKLILKSILQSLHQDLEIQQCNILLGMIKILEFDFLPKQYQISSLICEEKKINQQQINQYNGLLNNLWILRSFVPEFIFNNDTIENFEYNLVKIFQLEQHVQQINILHIFCGQMTIERLKKILDQYESINVVFIYALFSFTVEENFNCSGLSIYIKTKYFIVDNLNQILINLQGKEGEIIYPRKVPQYQNQINGINGLNGNDGQNGGSFYIDSKQYYGMNKLIINLCGGNGSDGQDGGDGMDGQNGKDADDQIVEKNSQNCENYHEEMDLYSLDDVYTFNKLNAITYISRGENGTKGGNSGRGGLGGQQGNKGQYKLINYNETIQIVDSEAKNGKKGADGKLGYGGINGKDYLRRKYDIEMFHGIKQETQSDQNFSLRRAIISLGTLGTVQSFGSIIQKLCRDGQWISEGQYISKGRAQNGTLNCDLQQNQECRIQITFQEYQEKFQIFIKNIQTRNQGPIFDQLF